MDTIPQYTLSNKHYVYTLAYPDGTVFYVGKGKGNRIDQHEIEAHTEKTHNNHKVRVIRKIWREGGEVLKNILAYFETPEEALRYEVSLIFLMRPCGHLTNLTDGGEGIVGLLRTEEHRRKISEALKGRKASEDTLKKLSETRKRNINRDHIRKMVDARKGIAWNKGIPGSPEMRRKLSEANKGRKKGPPSEETRRKISEANRRRPPRPPVSPETRQKLSEAMKGREFTPEWRKKISEANKGKGQGRKEPPEIVAKRAASNTGKKRTKEFGHKLSEIATRKRGINICVVCGKKWQPANYVEKRRKTCLSEECFSELMSRIRKRTINDQISPLGDLRQYRQLRLSFEDTDMSFLSSNAQEIL